MDLGLKGKKALVTGGASGIGQAIALDLAKEGVKVFITSREETKLKKAMDLLGGKNAGHDYLECDISEEGAVSSLIEQMHRKFGHPDIVVNNVGSAFGITDPYCPISDWRKFFRLNFEVAVEVNNLLLPFMKKQDWGRVVTITSGAALENSGPVPYCASKAALGAYTRSMGRVLATETKNVVMTAVMPGVVLTQGGHWDQVLKDRPEHAEKYLKERSPLGRFGKTTEISPMVVFLCSELASFCQGAIIPVDAGQAKHFMYFNYLP